MVFQFLKIYYHKVETIFKWQLRKYAPIKKNRQHMMKQPYQLLWKTYEWCEIIGYITIVVHLNQKICGGLAYQINIMPVNAGDERKYIQCVNFLKQEWNEDMIWSRDMITYSFIGGGLNQTYYSRIKRRHWNYPHTCFSIY